LCASPAQPSPDQELDEDESGLSDLLLDLLLDEDQELEEDQSDLLDLPLDGVDSGADHSGGEPHAGADHSGSGGEDQSGADHSGGEAHT